MLDRTQYVSVGGECFKDVPVTSGVPQGGVLGHTLFVYFTNNITFTFTCPLNVRVVRAPQMTSQPVSSIFL